MIVLRRRVAVASSMMVFLIGAGSALAQAPAADLAVTSITALPASPQIGNNFTYTITIRNNGPNQATGVVVTDMLPPQVSFVPGGSCSVDSCGTTVTCPVGSFTGTTTVSFTVKANLAGTSRNAAAIAGNEFDSSLGNNSMWIDTTINSPPAPAISGLSRISGTTSGGDSVIISGSNFVSGATAKFGTTAATVVSVNVPSQITVTTPGHAAGPVAVTVTNPDLQTSAPFNSFTYQCPSLSISPPSLPSGVMSVPYSQSLTATGGSSPYSFGVTSGSLPGGLTLSLAGVLSGTPTASGTFPFTVTVTDNWFCTGSRGYSLTISSGTLSLSSIFPTFGLTAGGTRVTIYGSGFQSGVSVKFGTAAATNLTLVDSGTLQVTTPGPGAGLVDVVVTNPSLETQRLTNGFSYGGLNSYSLPPCRIIDTRGPTGPYGGPALNAGADRGFVFINQCNIPPTAKAVIVNIAVTGPAGGGHFSLYPGGIPPPLVSTINYSAGQTRANNAILSLGSIAGDIIVHSGQGAGTAHIIIDVSGYLQ